jgi:hypothetical protein
MKDEESKIREGQAEEVGGKVTVIMVLSENYCKKIIEQGMAKRNREEGKGRERDRVER